MYIHTPHSNKFLYSERLLFHKVPSHTSSILNLAHKDDEKNLCPLKVRTKHSDHKAMHTIKKIKSRITELVRQY